MVRSSGVSSSGCNDGDFGADMAPVGGCRAAVTSLSRLLCT
eukprot:CAMPEP_0197901756 /NCGR_PEP_ID=MMETSP1439-20131203/51791_1 /TAXON_ID=66791 /ORGANISM="Gonyaulax spinifera, Strain CCMP409" /LENGTH=40 /DNA_ID= /DNA_START= /DNA_END= /DNA_ORIENTATION=